MNREIHVRICERLGVKFPGPTRPRGEIPRAYSPHRALQDREGSPGGSGSHSRAFEGLWVGVSSGEDQGCLLQG